MRKTWRRQKKEREAARKAADKMQSNFNTNNLYPPFLPTSISAFY
jgi:hypothetical protein